MTPFNRSCQLRGQAGEFLAPCLMLRAADTFVSRLRGLIGVTQLEPSTGLWLPRCNNIHMWFMSIPLDIVFLKRDSSVPIQGSTTAVITSVRKGLRPWTLLPVMDGRATDTLELPTGEVDRLGLQPGRVLCIS